MTPVPRVEISETETEGRRQDDPPEGFHQNFFFFCSLFSLLTEEASICWASDFRRDAAWDGRPLGGEPTAGTAETRDGRD